MSVTYCEKISRKQKKTARNAAVPYIRRTQQGTERTFHEEKEKYREQKLITLQRYKNALYQETERRKESDFHAGRKN